MPAKTHTRQDYSADRSVYEVQKNATQRVRIAHRNFKGHPYVDVRLLVVNQHGEYVATTQGISLRPELLAQIIQGLTIAARECEGGRQ
jgi:hypothetical protein